MSSTSGQLHPQGHGVTNSFDFVLDFLVWAATQREVTAKLIQRYLDCSRATSYRYLAGWKNFRSKHPHVTVVTTDFTQ